MAELEEVHQRVLTCTDCPLHRSRTHAVPGEGSPTARLMFIGEGPGYHEDQQGRPFVGPAGQLLNQLLASISLKREDVFITNMVKCRPPQNRDPYPGEIQACSHYLDAQIRLIRPAVIVPLGRHALARWFPRETITKARGRSRTVDGIIIFPMYHTAAVLRNPALRSAIENDFRKIAELLREGPAFKAPQGESAQRLSML